MKVKKTLLSIAIISAFAGGTIHGAHATPTAPDMPPALSVKQVMPAPLEEKKVEEALSTILVFIHVDGSGKAYTLPAGSTVEEALAFAKITFDSKDQLSLPLDSLLEDLSLLTVTRVKHEVETTTHAVAFESVKQEEKVQCEDEDAKTVVVQKGVEGEKIEFTLVTFSEGLAPVKSTVSEEVVKKAVNEVTADCKPKPEPEPTLPTASASATIAATENSYNSAPSRPNTSISGTKQDWMRAAGIPESDWQYVDYIVTRESSWDPNAVNKSSGACGLAQALPCSKLGPNWNDPVTALKWQYNYVQQRYGGYAGAYAFWTKNHWY